MGIQVDNGDFTRLHNTILEKLALARLSASEYRCLMFLFRMTYGWQRKEYEISMTEWAKGIGIDPEKRHNAWRTLQGMVDKSVIYAESNGNNRPMTWGFNKHFEQWDASLFDTTVITDDNSCASEDNAEPEPTVINSHNTSVITHDNTTVIKADNTHIRRKKDIKKPKKNTATQPAKQARAPTYQQEMFGAICEALGWDSKTLTKDDKGRIAQAISILRKADYGVDDIRQFMVKVWFRDYRWEKFSQRPTLTQLRQEIGKVRATVPPNGASNGTHRNNGTARNDQPEESIVLDPEIKRRMDEKARLKAERIAQRNGSG